MGTGRKKINIEKVQDIRRRRVTLTKRRQGLFKKMEKFQIVTGFDVAAVVFTIAGKPNMLGDLSVFRRYMSEVLGSGGDFEFDNETVGHIRLGFEKLGEEVRECVDCDKLVMMRNKLLELKDKLKGVLSDEETEARAMKSSVPALKVLGSKEKKKLEFLEKSLKEITTLCDVDALFICATKSNETSESSFHTYPGHQCSVRKLIFKCYDSLRKPSEQVPSKNIVADKVLPHNTVFENPISQSIAVAENPMSTIATENPISSIAVENPVTRSNVSAEEPMSQSTAAAENPISQITVAAEKPMSPGISAAEKVLSATISKAELVKKVNRLIKLISVKLAMLKEAKVANEGHGMHKGGSTDFEVLEGSRGKLLPYIKFL